MNKKKSKDTKGAWIVTVVGEKRRAYDVMPRRHRLTEGESLFGVDLSAPPRLRRPIPARRVGKPRFRPVYKALCY